MKKQFLTTLCAALILTACGQKNAQVAMQSDNQQVANTEVAAYDHLNPSQDEGKPKKKEDLSGKVISLTSEEFRELVKIDQERGLLYKGKTPCMVDFYADWCRPCMQLKPATERLAEKYKGKIIIYKVNIDKAQDIAQLLGISNIPTLLFFKPNTQPAKIVGAPTEEELERVIKEFVGL